MQRVQIWLRLKQVLIAFLCILGFTASQLSFVSSTYAVPASGGGSVSITIGSPNIEINIHGCATIPVSGEGFTPADRAQFSVVVAGGESVPRLTVNPTSVSVGARGNFFIPLSVCNLSSVLSRTPTTTLLLTAVDRATGRSTGPVSVSVSVPIPSIYSNASASPLLNDCGTVVVFGDGFVPSTERANYAVLRGFVGTGGAPLRGSTRANVLVNGNIATSIQLCGLSVGDTFSVQAVDAATNQRSGYLSFTAVEATPSVTPAASIK